MKSFMYVIVLTYKRPLEDVDAFLADHVAFLDAQYEAGVFVVSGRRHPRVGGVILATSVERDVLERILETDPFKREGIADYEVIEFVPTKMQAGFEPFVG